MTGSEKRIPCPDCKGEGQIFGFINGGPSISTHRAGHLHCFRCGGSGDVPEAMLGWIEAGRAMRADRMRRGETMLTEAKRLEISIATLSSIELGKVNPGGHAQYKRETA